MTKYMSEKDAYQMYLDYEYEDLWPFKSVYGEHSFLDVLKDFGWVILSDDESSEALEEDDWISKNNKITTKQIKEQYNTYLKALNKWESINGEVEDSEIIPYEIQELNPFK